MKNDSTITMLLAALAVSALASVIILLFFYVPGVREARNLQGQAMFINNRRAAVASLVNDVVEYSKKNPAIDPLLEQIGAKPPKNAPAAAAPTTKPTAK